jgi:hypothetical protein
MDTIRAGDSESESGAPLFQPLFISNQEHRLSTAMGLLFLAHILPGLRS